ncbi:MAG TPA: hypothetical protein PLJ00_16590 [Chitinophagales bacterium]|nr:hypothetical protein [Chitinophagales bacterium]HRG29519.1 hypothetical protein [Chitinophagales bacterium]HRG87224.1 hypothetical protein [Chitinophagales bacterium]HRH52654.1 hypothetical protein [Chitinophagales bacterium]
MNKIIKMILVLHLAFGAKVMHAQCLITAVKPGEMFTLDQLWNVVVSGNLPPGQYKVGLTLSSAKNLVYKAETRAFNYNNNSITISFANKRMFEPLVVQYMDPNFNTALMQAAGIVPDGRYTVAFTLIDAGTNTEELCKTSYRLIVEKNIAPLQLLFVHKNDTIKESCPTFGWIPPFPLPTGDYNYELLLTECYDNQTAFDATTSNLPVYKMTVGKNIQKNVCSDLAKLEPGKSYAWKINLYQNGKFDNTSESWKFFYEPEDSANLIEPEKYFHMDDKVYGSYVVIDSNLLPIYFKEDYNVIDSIINVVLYDSAMNVYAEGEHIMLAYNNGSNHSYLNFCNYDFELAKGMYLLEITCITQKKYFIRFKNKSELTDCY